MVALYSRFRSKGDSELISIADRKKRLTYNDNIIIVERSFEPNSHEAEVKSIAWWSLAPCPTIS